MGIRTTQVPPSPGYMSSASKVFFLCEVPMSSDFHLLVGGWTSPFEKYLSKWESSPSRGENKKFLKPPPSLFLRSCFIQRRVNEKNKSPPVSGPMSSGLAFVQKDVGRPCYLEIPPRFLWTPWLWPLFPAYLFRTLHQVLLSSTPYLIREPLRFSSLQLPGIQILCFE